MEVAYLKSLEKDLKKIKNKKLLKSLANVFVKLEKVETLFEISGVIKMVGHSEAYRIGDFRLGIFYSEEKITIARFLKREDIYKLFP
jgi:mRNA-degrading endonuclease RelE of RelBE toxin-antitoxin system